VSAAISLAGVGKAYRSYAHEYDRLLEVLTGRPRHRDFHALADVSLEIPHGQVLGVVGANGAGKSTLLKLIAGTAQPTAGEIRVNGRVAALLELGGGFHPEMTGRDNVFLSGAIMGLTREQIEALYPSIVEFAGIPDFMDQPVKTYSSGMFVRLAFSVATCVDPDILIIDEALSVGDGAFARKSFERIKAIRDQGKTILFCSHSMYQVEAICNRAIWIERGRVRMDGEPGTVTAAYNRSLDQSAPAPAASGAVSTETAPAPAAVTHPQGSARITRIEACAGGRCGRELEIESGKTDLSVTVAFASDPALPAPTVALAIRFPDFRIAASAGTHNDGIAIERTPDGRGEVTVEFPALPLLKGEYSLAVFLLCENGLHPYDRTADVAELRVRQQGLEQGVVSLPHRWAVNAPAAEPSVSEV